LDEIKVTIVTYISNLGKTVTVGMKLTQRISESKTFRINDCTSCDYHFDVIIGSFLPPRVVAELELNSINPPPDIVEEENEERFLSPISLRRAGSS
jgi:hypothetical protein